MDHLVEEMQTYYEKRASVYDASMGYDQPAKVAELQPVIEQLQAFVSNKTILELACGPGYWTGQAATVVASIVATDYNESTLEEARRKGYDPSIVTFQAADAYNLPQFPKQFEACFAVDWFAHIPRSRLDSFLSGLVEKIQPAGPIIFIDQLPRPHSKTGRFDHEGNHLQQRSLPDGSQYNVIKHYFSDETYRHLFTPFASDIEIVRFDSIYRILTMFYVKY